MCIGYMQILCHFRQGTRASLDFGVCGVPGTNLPQIPRDDCRGKLKLFVCLNDLEVCRKMLQACH